MGGAGLDSGSPALKLSLSWWWVLVCFFLLLVLTGCNPVYTQSQPLNTSFAILQPGTTLGQTFVASYNGLSGIEVILKPTIIQNGIIILHLRSAPDAQYDLTTTSLPLESITKPGIYRFSFEPLLDSRRQYYYAFLEIQGETIIEVGSAWGGAYNDGALYQDHKPDNFQMTFTLFYDRGTVFSDIMQQAVIWKGMLFIAVCLYILPGWAVLKCFWGDWDDFSWFEKAALASGVSLAIIPLLFLWTDILGIHLGSWYAWLLIVASILGLLWLNRSRLKPGKFSWPGRERVLDFFGKNLTNIILLFVLIAVISVRFMSISTLDLPMWGDSYQHTMITQLIMDNGGLYDSWRPYAQLDSLTYHFGFHADASLFGWVTNLSASRTVIWVGQIMNSLAVLAIYPLALRLGGNRWAGIGAVLLAGLLFPMPMTYVNWGRYTQLAGQTILPVFVLLFLVTMQKEETNWKKLAVLAITLCGLALTHYRILIFALAALAGYIVLEMRRKNYRSVLTRIVIFCVGAFALFLPWFLHVFGARLLEILGSQLSTPAGDISSGLSLYNSIGDITAYLPYWAWMLTILALVIGLLFRKRYTAFIFMWWALIFLAANPSILGLPGTGTLSNFAVFIALYIPAAILIGAAFGWLMETHFFSVASTSSLVSSGLLLIVFAFSWIGWRQRLSDVRINEFSLATRPDLHAMAWIREHTPLEAKFVVNFFFSYLDQLIVGADGGWWLPLMTERQTNLPPLTYGIEAGSGDEYLNITNTLAENIQTYGITDTKIIEELINNGYYYVYIGQRMGLVNNSSPVVLDPDVLSSDLRFNLIYHRDLVWIFKIIP